MDYFATGTVYVEKAQLDYLANQVAEAQYQVNQQQANVDALTSKSSEFNGFLSAADADKQTALTNLNMARDIDAGVKGLMKSTGLAKKQNDKACVATVAFSKEVSVLINKLIFAVEIIDKFGQLVNKQKISNPLIPDTLISLIAKSASDANNAIALTLTALQSCYAAEASSLRAQKVIDLQTTQMSELMKRFECTKRESADSAQPDFADASMYQGPGLLALSEAAYQFFDQKYHQTLADNNMVNKQLAHAQQMLAKATTSLNSWQSGLAAATAAAYAA